MNSKIVAVYDQDKSYIESFLEFITSHNTTFFTFQMFTKEDALLKYAEGNNISVLLVSDKNCNEKISKLHAELFILLEEDEQQTKEYEGIRKFQSAEKVLQQIKQHYLENRKESLVTNVHKKSNLIGIYTPGKDMLQTPFSILLGQELSKNNKVLYINLQNFSGLHILLGREFPNDFSDLLYYLKGNKERLEEKINIMIQSVNGLDFIPPAFSYFDLITLTPSEWREIIQLVEEKTDYDYIIFELGDGIQGLFEILSACEKIYSIMEDNGFSLAKTEHYKELLQKTEHQEILGKTKETAIPKMKIIPSKIQDLPYSGLGQFVKGIVEEDFNGES